MNLEQGQDTVPQAVVLVVAGAILLCLGIEELAAVAIGGHFAHNELRASLSPIDRGAYGQFIRTRIELQLAVRQLEWNQLAITLQQRGGDKFLFGSVKSGMVVVMRYFQVFDMECANMFALL